MRHAFRIAGGTRGVVNNRWRLNRCIGAIEVGGLARHFHSKWQPAIGLAHTEPELKARALFVFRGIGRCGDGRHCARMLDAVLDILGGEHLDAGDRYGAQLGAGGHHLMPLRDTRQLHDDAVASLNAAAPQNVCNLAAELADVGELVELRRARLVDGNQRQLVHALSLRIDHIAAKVKACRQVPMERCDGFFVIRHGRNLHVASCGEPITPDASRA